MSVAEGAKDSSQASCGSDTEKLSASITSWTSSFLPTKIRKRYLPWIGIVATMAFGGVCLWWHAQAYAPFFTDDGFISLRYTERLLHGHGLTWNDGDRVEGYSNLLWVLLCAVPGVLGIDLVRGARALGLACMIATFGALIATARPKQLAHWIGPLVVISFLAATDSIAVWSMGGLEPPLVCALLSWGIVMGIRAITAPTRALPWATAACFGLLSWTRPDGALWGIVFATASSIVYGRRASRVTVPVFAMTLAFTAAQTLFRVVYYHDYLPNTAYAKVVLNDERLQGGITHLGNSLIPLAAMWLALVVSAAQGLSRKHLRAPTFVATASALAWTCYLVRIGGDNFPAWRHFPYLLVLTGLTLTWVLSDDLRTGRIGATLRWGVALIVLAAVDSRFDTGNWAKQEVWQWDGVPIGDMLHRAFGKESPLFASDAAGTIPFYSKLPSLDMLGLNDRYLAHHRPPGMGHSMIGHELGDGAYYLRRKPDILCFGVPPCSHRPKFTAQYDMVRAPEFHEHYAAARFNVPGERPMVSELWVRRDGPIGIRYDTSGVGIPSYFLADHPRAIAQLDGDDRFVTALSPNARSSVSAINLPAGSWILQTIMSSGTATVNVRRQGLTLGAAPLTTPLRFTMLHGGLVDVTIIAGESGCAIGEIHIRKAS